jgi:hypothetical protein
MTFKPLCSVCSGLAQDKRAAAKRRGKRVKKKQKTAKEKLGVEPMLTMFLQFPESSERGNIVALIFPVRDHSFYTFRINVALNPKC